MTIKIKTFEVDRDFSDTRLDKFLKIKVSKFPQSLIEKNLRKKKILVNKKKSKSSYKLNLGDKVEIFFDAKIEQLKPRKKIIKNDELIKIRKHIIFDCKDYLVLNKPYGYASQDGLKVKKNIIDILNQEEKKYYIIHRLDMETTGVMLFAKNREYAKKFSDQFQSRNIKKKYYVIVKGSIPKNKGEIITKEKIRKKEVVSKSYFEVKNKNQEYSFLEVEILTGRKHQIRKQFSELGHPVIGDTRYGDKNSKNQLCLFSYHMEFEYLNKIKKYSLKLPKFMEDFVQRSFYNF